MPTDYTIDPVRRLVISRAYGILTEEESSGLYDELESDPEFDPSFRQICDLTEVTDLDASADHLRTLAKDLAFRRSSRRAFVAPSDFVYGLARMLEAYIELEGGDVGVFHTRAEAEAWLSGAGPQETLQRRPST